MQRFNEIRTGPHSVYVSVNVPAPDIDPSTDSLGDLDDFATSAEKGVCAQTGG